jgi:hypothetical protein
MSDRHQNALQSHLTRGGNNQAQTRAPANPLRTIAASTIDETLQSARAAARRNAAPAPSSTTRDALDGPSAQQSDEYAENAYVRKMMERGRARRGSGKNGSFDSLRAKVREHTAGSEPMTKSTPSTPGDYSIEQAMSDLRSVPVPRSAGASKPLMKSMAKTARALGNTTLAKSLEAGYGTNSATLTGGSALRRQSLDKRLQSTAVGGDPKPAPRPKLLTKAQIAAACSRGMTIGKLTPQECMKAQSCMDMDQSIPDDLLKTITTIHNAST